MLVVAHVLISIARSNTSLAHDDDSGWTTINTESAAGANVFVDDKHDVIIRIGSWGNNVDGIGDRGSGEHVNALPWANIDATFAHDAFRLVNVEKLFGLDALVQIVNGDLGQGVATRERWHWR